MPQDMSVGAAAGVVPEDCIASGWKPAGGPLDAEDDLEADEEEA